jgi:dephospho-CoA kinase
MTASAPRRFALIGKSGAGKSTAAEMIFDFYGARRVSTGVICRKISRLLMGNEDKASTQKIDDALTTIDQSIFLNAALRDIPDNDAICLDSLRFRSDLQIARERGFLVVRITAPDEIRILRLKERGQVFDQGVDGCHRSETELDDAEVDFVIHNNGSREAMRLAVENIGVRGS